MQLWHLRQNKMVVRSGAGKEEVEAVSKTMAKGAVFPHHALQVCIPQQHETWSKRDVDICVRAIIDSWFFRRNRGCGKLQCYHMIFAWVGCVVAVAGGRWRWQSRVIVEWR